MDDEHREPGSGGTVHGQPLRLDDRPLAGGSPVAPDSRWWNDVEGRHRTLILGGIIAGVVVLAVGIGVAVAILGSRMSQDAGPSAPLTGTIPETTESVVTTIPSPSQVATESSLDDADAVARVGSRPVSRLPQGRRRLGREGVGRRSPSASSPRCRVRSPCLPTDGRWRSWTPRARPSRSSTWTAVGRRSWVRPWPTARAGPPTPPWSCTASQVVGGHDTEVSRVNRDGSGRATVGPGFAARFAPDGAIVAVSSARTAQGTPIELYAAGGIRRLTEGVTVNALTPLKDRVVFADAGELLAQDRLRSPSLQVIKYDGSGQKTLVAKPAAGTETYFGDMLASPDGSWVAYTETGDDGYSRLFAIHPSGGVPIPLSLRRDDYIMGWSADGSEIMFVEGNKTQEESTRLMAVHPDGTGRRTILEGAGQ